MLRQTSTTQAADQQRTLELLDDVFERRHLKNDSVEPLENGAGGGFRINARIRLTRFDARPRNGRSRRLCPLPALGLPRPVGTAPTARPGALRLAGRSVPGDVERLAQRVAFNCAPSMRTEKRANRTRSCASSGRDCPASEEAAPATSTHLGAIRIGRSASSILPSNASLIAFSSASRATPSVSQMMFAERSDAEWSRDDGSRRGELRAVQSGRCARLLDARRHRREGGLVFTEGTSAKRADATGRSEAISKSPRSLAMSTVSVRSDTRMEPELKPRRRPRGCARSWRARRSSAAA